MNVPAHEVDLTDPRLPDRVREIRIAAAGVAASRVLANRIEIFTHIDPLTQQVRHFDATAMLAWLAAVSLPHPDLDWLNVAMDGGFIDLILRQERVDRVYLARLSPRHLLLPVLAVHMADDSTLMVDGNHRLVRWAQMGATVYPMFRWHQGTWDHFLLDLPPDASRKLAAEIRL